ncbi:MAG: response regulator transcription factor [Dehalococcoidia bacterium]|nr:response regulator transcription factor [Dehalococcoidia bacterium]
MLTFVITDVRMPRLNGIQLLSELKKRLPGVKALMLSAFDDEDYILASLKGGASGYLLKTIDLEKLAQAIRTVHGGHVVIDPVVAAKMAGVLAREPSVAKVELLSPREYDILRLVSRGMRTGQIADELGLNISTVAKHVTKILEKLGVSSRSEAVRYALSKLIID